MANETKNQDFNKSIKQLQSMVKDKLFISLAEKFYNLKGEMSALTRAVKEKETNLIVGEKKEVAEPKPPVAPVVSQPKIEKKPQTQFEADTKKPQQNFKNNANYNQNKKPNFNHN